MSGLGPEGGYQAVGVLWHKNQISQRVQQPAQAWALTFLEAPLTRLEMFWCVPGSEPSGFLCYLIGGFGYYLNSKFGEPWQRCC